jgi:uncharacterized membrane protein
MLNQFLPEVNDPSANINNLVDNLSNIILNTANKTFHFKQFKRNKKRKRYKQNFHCYSYKYFATQPIQHYGQITHSVGRHVKK